MKVAIIGVGAMGRDMAGHLTRAQHSVRAVDIDMEALALVAEEGIETADSIQKVPADTEVYLVVVATDAQSEAVTDEVLKVAQPGAAIVIAATNNVTTMQALAARATEKGVRFVDAPVCFGRQGAREGTLVSLCGGKAEDVEFVTPALMAYSRAVHHVGPVGAGQLAKTCNNMLHWAHCVANYEALLLAKRWGVDAQRMREILLDCPATNGTLERWDGTRFTWQEKDMDVAMDLAQQGKVPMPLFGQIDQLVKQLNAQGVADLLYGPEAEYLGVRITPLAAAEGGLREE